MNSTPAINKRTRGVLHKKSHVVFNYKALIKCPGLEQ